MTKHTKIYTVEELVATESFQRYCLNSNADDTAYWESIILENWSQRSTFEQAFHSVYALKDQRLFSSEPLDAKVVTLSEKLPSEPQRSNIKMWFAFIGSIAAVLLIVFCINTSLLHNEELLYITDSTNFGEIKNIELPDQSTVTLNANSSISYPSDMTSSRMVNITGEAYFSVETTPDRMKFTVLSDQGNIVVTGTEFNLSLRNEILQATLIEGAIIYQKENMDDIILSPDDQLVVRNNTIQIKQTETMDVTAWRDGRLKFKNTQMSDVIDRLQDLFGINVIVRSQNLLTRNISANMVTSDPVALLESIGLIYGFEVVENGDDIIIK